MRTEEIRHVRRFAYLDGVFYMFGLMAICTGFNKSGWITPLWTTPYQADLAMGVIACVLSVLCARESRKHG